MVHTTVRRTRTGSIGPSTFGSFIDRYAGSFVRQWEAFVHAVATGGPSPASGRDARAPLVIGLAANESLRTGAPVSLVG
jgi:predicted dehydrogenase